MSGGGEKLGLATAVDDAMDALADRDALSPLVPSEQLDLLAAAEPDADKRAAHEARLAVHRRAGRPKGAKNKSTEEWSKWILSQYQSPLVVLAETYSRPVAELAAELSCDKLDAFKIQQAAAGKLAEYVHQKMPVAIEAKGEGAVPLFFAVGAGMQQAALDGDAGALLVQATQIEDAELIEGGQDGEQGHDAPETACPSVENKTQQNQQVNGVEE